MYQSVNLLLYGNNYLKKKDADPNQSSDNHACCRFQRRRPEMDRAALNQHCDIYASREAKAKPNRPP